MPNKCCVYGCNSNYASTKERYSTFKFPRDDDLPEKWIRKIPNKDLKATKYVMFVKSISLLMILADITLLET